jgi:hypothetical protein
MRDLERLSEKLKAAVDAIEARRVAVEARKFDLEHDPRPDFCRRLEQ